MIRYQTSNYGKANRMVQEGWKIIKEDKMILPHNVIHYIITLEKENKS